MTLSLKELGTYGMPRAINGCELESKGCCMQRKRCMISVSRVTLQYHGVSLVR